MKKVVFKAAPGENGFVRTTLAPVNDKDEAKLSWLDIMLLLALVIGGVAVARVVLAH